MITYTTILIDDEPIARQRMASLLEANHPQIEIIGEAANGIEGAEIVNRLKPDLIFLDIQMPGKTGFEMLEDLSHVPQVVFCTAYDEFALQAFGTLAVDYLVKPVEEERLALTMKKIAQHASEGPGLQIEKLLELVKPAEDKKPLLSIPHKIGDRIILVKTENITYLSASDKYVEYYTADGKKYLTEQPLKKLLERLPDNFKQIHRSIIVNLDHVKEYRKFFRGKYILVLDDLNSTELETGRSYAESINAYLSL